MARAEDHQVRADRWTRPPVFVLVMLAGCALFFVGLVLPLLGI